MSGRVGSRLSKEIVEREPLGAPVELASFRDQGAGEVGMTAAPQGRPMLTVRVLGGLELELDGRPLPALAGRCGSLLAWLALHDGMQPRSRVAAKLWPEVLDESARQSLRTALVDLRRTLGPEAERYVRATRHEIGLWPAEDVWVDARAFAAAAAAEDLERALALARGEVLPEFDHEWAFAAREQHERVLAGVVEQLAADAEQRGDLGTAIEHTHRLVAMDPLAEEPARALIRRLAAAGDRAAALTVFERYRGRLRSVLRVVPSAQTRELVEQIRSGEPEGAARVPRLFTRTVAGSPGPLAPDARYGHHPAAGLSLRRRAACDRLHGG